MTKRKKPEDRLKTGRPTTYDPSYCEVVVELGKKGKQSSQMAMHLNVTKQTLHEWASVHPPFFDAFKRSREYCEAWLVSNLEKKVIGQNKNGDVGAMKFLLSACHGYREKTDTTVTAQVETKITVREWGDEPKQP